MCLEREVGPKWKETILNSEALISKVLTYTCIMVLRIHGDGLAFKNHKAKSYRGLGTAPTVPIVEICILPHPVIHQS